MDKYPKLVRDRIPAIIKEKTGTEPECKTLTDDKEFLDSLLQKMVEESLELQNSATENNLEEELADILELIQAILKLRNRTMEDIMVIQAEKRGKRGGFDKRILMLKESPGRKT
jgi:predicted house-cleaning noncanonical NTP pyrophosphatase (MazG superfamily)